MAGYLSLATIAFVVVGVVYLHIIKNRLDRLCNSLTAFKEIEWEYVIADRYYESEFAPFKDDLNKLGDLNYQAVAAWTEPGREGQGAVFVLMKRPTVK